MKKIKGIVPELVLTVALVVGTVIILTGVLISSTYEPEVAEPPVSTAQAEVQQVQEAAPEPVVVEEYEPMEILPTWMTKLGITLRELYEWVALVITEAGDQSDECQRAVASVVLNRYHSPYYPNTIHGVITQHGQYEPVIKGKTDYYIDVMENIEPISEEKFEEFERALENVLYVIENGSTLPSEDYVYQAQFDQGVDVIQIGSEKFGRRVK